MKRATGALRRVEAFVRALDGLEVRIEASSGHSARTVDLRAVVALARRAVEAERRIERVRAELDGVKPFVSGLVFAGVANALRELNLPRAKPLSVELTGDEQREANLRGALKNALHVLHVARVALTVVRVDDHPDLPVVQQAIGAIAEVLGPNPPDYVSASQLRAVEAERDAWKAQSRGTWGALFEQLAETNAKPTDLALALCRELGLHAQLTDEQLLVELGARGFIGPLNERPVELRIDEKQIRDLMRHEPKVAPYDRAAVEAARRYAAGLDEIRDFYSNRAACPHCNDLPYDGPTLACPACGIDRHGVGHGAG